MADDPMAPRAALEIAAQMKPVVDAAEPKHREWDQAWERLHSEPPEVVYHYTNADGLLGIVQAHQLRASNAAFLNDSTELVHVQKILETVVAELRDVYSEGTPARLLTFIERLLGLSQEWFDVYVACFCRKDDLLSQWRGYPPVGGGYAIGFNSASLARDRGVLRKVIYELDTQRRLIRELVEPVCEGRQRARRGRSVTGGGSLCVRHRTAPLADRCELS
jgi:hypothetical protein